MTIGTSSFWLNSLKDIDIEFIKCIERVWPLVKTRIKQSEKEDYITERLVDLLRKDREVCKIGFLTLHFKLRQEETSGDFTTKGILDMALFLGQDHEHYIAYECKRLNVVNTQGKRTASLAGPYIEEGVVRYTTAKYSEKLPYGCMIGYVMDGDTSFAFKQLETALIKRSELINLESYELRLFKSPNISFETTHKKNSNSSVFTVRHRLLSIVN